jgi:tetratricopeptide (TPR) repeat protein
MNRVFLLFIAIGTIFLTACSQKVVIKALNPAEISRVASTKKISIAPFSNDRVNLSSKIEANLAKHTLDGENYFTIVSRNDFDKILREQKIQNSGLIDQNTAVEVGSLIGAEAIISGNVGRVTSSDTRYYETRTRCADKKCKEMTVYRVRCLKRAVGLSADIRVVDVVRGDIIYADTMSRNKVYRHCIDDANPLPAVYMVAENLASSIADSFTYKLAPHYRNFEVTLLEEPDLDYTDKQKELLKFSLEYIEQRRYDKAQTLLLQLIDSTAQQSYVPFYNLGVLKEAEGNYEEAKEYYEVADSLMTEPVEEISNAYIRIQSLIKKRKKAYSQIREGK